MTTILDQSLCLKCANDCKASCFMIQKLLWAVCHFFLLVVSLENTISPLIFISKRLYPSSFRVAQLTKWMVIRQTLACLCSTVWPGKLWKSMFISPGSRRAHLICTWESCGHLQWISVYPISVGKSIDKASGKRVNQEWRGPSYSPPFHPGILAVASFTILTNVTCIKQQDSFVSTCESMTQFCT